MEVKKELPNRILATGIKVFIALFFIYQLLYILGLFTTQYFYILPESHRAMSLGLIITLTFLLKRARKGDSQRIPWYDWLLIVAGLVGCFYMAPTSKIQELEYASPVLSPLELTLSIVTVLVLLEATRRVSGIALPLILVFFIFYAMYAEHFPGLLYGMSHEFPRLMGELYLSLDGIFGIVMGLWVSILVVFIVFGGLLEASGAGQFFINLALSLAGHVRGGPAKVAIIASGLFGTMNGSAAANVATTGVITIPMMKGVGYKPGFAGATEAVASTGGIIMPPMMGMVAFMVAEFLDVPYIEVCIAAAIPAFLYYFTLYWQVDFESIKSGLKGLPKSELPSLKQTLRGGWFYFVPLLVLIYFLAVLRYPAGMCCMYSIFALILVSMFKKESRLTPKRIMAGFEAAARSTLVVAVICGSVGILITSIMITGATLRMAVLMVQASGGSVLIILVLAGIVSLLLGTGMPAIASYIFLAVTVAPALVQLGLPIMAAHLFVFYWGTSHVITPPVGGCLYIASSLSGVSMWRQGYYAVRLGIAVYMVPFLFAYHPALLMMGTPLEIALAIVFALIGMFCVASGFSGYLVKPANWIQRGMLLGAAVALFVQSFLAIVVGLALVVIVLLWQGITPVAVVNMVKRGLRFKGK